ncbi:MAG: DUF4294 domain-containing protein [Williamsia sp.]|nr:DUF4294 domain-containing protein [Williamsia sp.]
MVIGKHLLYRVALMLTLTYGLIVIGTTAHAQQQSSRYGPNDTLRVPYIVYQGDTISARELETYYVTAEAPPAMKARLREWTRLRNAVYVTYPYARKAGAILNDINAHLAGIKESGQRKAYIKSREGELKKEFTEPLTNLSIYQGKILMKLINRQTGNNCYEIIKEYKGGLTARLYQTVAFFFSTSLKQPYDAAGEDQQIEMIVKEVERMYGKH